MPNIEHFLSDDEVEANESVEPASQSEDEETQEGVDPEGIVDQEEILDPEGIVDQEESVNQGDGQKPSKQEIFKKIHLHTFETEEECDSYMENLAREAGFKQWSLDRPEKAGYCAFHCPIGGRGGRKKENIDISLMLAGNFS